MFARPNLTGNGGAFTSPANGCGPSLFLAITTASLYFTSPSGLGVILPLLSTSPYGVWMRVPSGREAISAAEGTRSIWKVGKPAG